jgi:hypothetical protein
MHGIHYKGMRGKSNVIKKNAKKVWGARYLSKNMIITFMFSHVSQFVYTDQHCMGGSRDAANRTQSRLCVCIIFFRGKQWKTTPKNYPEFSVPEPY